MSTTNSKHNLRSISLFLRRISSFAAIAALAVTAACSSDSISAPRDGASASASQGLISSTLGVVGRVLIKDGLQRDAAVSEPIVVSQLIKSSQGGRIEIKSLGLRIDVPAGAIPRDTMTITVTALPGRMVAYDFQPHGTKFNKALDFQQNLSGTTWDNLLLKPALYGAYFKDPNQLIPTSGKALIDELIPTLVFGNRVEFDIWHFSGYMVSMD